MVYGLQFMVFGSGPEEAVKQTIDHLDIESGRPVSAVRIKE